jgi:hypothetical protein
MNNGGRRRSGVSRSHRLNLGAATLNAARSAAKSPKKNPTADALPEAPLPAGTEGERWGPTSGDGVASESAP